MKTCKTCEKQKDPELFAVCKKAKDGMQSSCKSCNADYRQKNHLRINEYIEAYREKNAERISSVNAAYKTNNKSEISEARKEYERVNRISISKKCKIYSEAKRVEISDQHRKYRAENPEIISNHARRRRAQVKGARGSHTVNDISSILGSQRGLCATCEAKLFKTGKSKFHVDHITPLSKGGSNDKYNLQCLCPKCNLRKNAKDPIDWAKENGRLL